MLDFVGFRFFLGVIKNKREYEQDLVCVFHLYILPVLAFLSPGLLIRRQLAGRLQLNDTFRSFFVETLILSSFFLFVPMVFFGVFIKDSLNVFVYTYYAFGLGIIIFYVLKLLQGGSIDYTFIKEKFHQQSSLAIFIEMSVIFILIAYMLLNIIYPIRGWDALHFYFPNGYYFYLADDIPSEPNPLNFFPTFKPPINALYISYSYYTTGGFYLQLFPILFIIGISFLLHDLSLELGLSRNQANFAQLILLTTPAFYMIVLEYMYYQELPLMFFFSAGLIYFYRSTKQESRYYAILGALSFGLATLSKVSGFTSPFLLLLVFGIPLACLNLPIRLIALNEISLVLIYRASTETFLGVGLFILLITILLNLQILISQEKLPKIDIFAITSYTVIVGLIATFWLIHMQRSGILSELIDFYSSIDSNQIQFSFPSGVLIAESFAENAHKASFLTSILVIFIGSQFNLLLTIPKIIGIWVASKKYPFLNLWAGSFYIIWLSYYSTVSIRYLAVIWIPLTLYAILGIDYIIDYFSIKKFESTIYLLFAGSNFLFLYPFIPIEIITLDFNERMFEYHNNVFRLFFYFIALSLLFGLVIFRLQKLERKISSHRAGMYNKRISIVLLVVISLSPIAVQTGVLVSTGFDLDEFQAVMVYEEREAVQDFIAFFETLAIGLEDITIVTNFPGLEYKILRPVLDLFLVSQLQNANFSTSFENANVSRVFQDFSDNKVRFIVDLNPDHDFYEAYAARFVARFPFLSSLTSEFVQLLYANSDFSLFEIVNYK